jgi:hypothetical protein
MQPVHTSDRPAIHAQGGGVFQSLLNSILGPMPSSLVLTTAALLAFLSPSAAALAQPAIERRPVAFPSGGASAQRTGQLQGDQTVDYILRASAGQSLSVELQASNPQAEFNVVAAGAEQALFIGSVSGQHFRGLLPSDGEVTVRVFLMRAAARRQEPSAYTLRFGITGTPLTPLPASRDALIPGTPYHASTEVVCGLGSKPLAARCKAFVIRRANNSATVVVTNPKGQKRQFLFVRGQALASDQAEPLSVRRRGDFSLLTLGDNLERYEIVDALVVGG